MGMVKSMNSRMDKYYKENTLEESRTSRNKEIYNKVSEEDIDKLSLTSNISIIDADTTNLDIEKLKAILEEKYSKQKSSIPQIEEESVEEELEDTKEYDLRKVIDEAHKNKSSDYAEDRFKKLRDTQFDILSSLNLDRDEDPIGEESLTVEEANLMNLIKTINEKPIKNNQEPDLLEELKGSENTEVLDPVDLEGEYSYQKPTIVEELEKTKKLSKKEVEDIQSKVQEISAEPEDIEDDETSELDSEIPKENSFYTGKYQIKDSDFDDFSDIQKEIKSGNIVIKILILLLVIIVLVVGVYFLNKYLNLGLF